MDAGAADRMITLISDFGLSDAYVGTMKGVILGINPRATIVDICHHIEPQNIAQAAFVLDTAYRYFPPGTIHVVVVDPGVGTKRRAILLATPSALFLAPDNGVLSYVLENSPGSQAIALTNPSFWRSPVSQTFHGRDIFAPAAAHLSLGTPPQHLGEVCSQLTTFRIPRPQRASNGAVGQVVHIDRFGNLITNLREGDLPEASLWIEIAGYRIPGVSPSYTEGEEVLALFGSSGNLEIAVKNGSAASRLGATIGEKIILTKRQSEAGNAK